MIPLTHKVLVAGEWKEVEETLFNLIRSTKCVIEGDKKKYLCYPSPEVTKRKFRPTAYKKRRKKRIQG
jgi:hypothetical protein